MNKIKACLLALGLGTVIMMSMDMESRAEELKDENPNRLEEVTVVDEEGNVTVVEDVYGKLDESEISTGTSRATEAQLVNFNTKGNATTSYTEYSTGTAGYTNGAYGADAAYLGTENGKVKFMLAGVVGLVSSSEVQVVNLSDAKYVSYYYVNSGRLWHKIYTKITSGAVSSSLDQGAAPSYLSSGKTYYSYDGHYFYTNYATMLADYQKSVRTNSVNPKNPYYNYYQFLPLRSSVTYSASAFKTLIDKKATSTSSKSKMIGLASSLVEHQNTYGVNALIVAGVAANESTWGASSYALNRNNLFGLNAVDSNPDKATYFDSAAECARQFAETYMSKRYLRPGYWAYFGGFLGNKAAGINVKYASDPYWGEKAANWAWYIDKQGGSKDAGAYTIGIKDLITTNHSDVNVRSGSNTSSASLYKTGKAANYAVLVLKSTPENSFYKIQSDGVLNTARSALDTSTGVYNFSSMHAYISSNYVTIVNSGEDISTLETPTLVSAAESNRKVIVTWKKVTDATGYYVYRKVSGGSWSKIATISSGSTVTYTDSSAPAGYTYYYTVRAYDSSGALSDYDKTGVKAVVPEKLTVYLNYVTTTSVNYRTGPGTSYDIAGKLASGTTISVEDGYSKTANGYTWYRFVLNGNTYYISSKYLTIQTSIFYKSSVVRYAGDDRYATAMETAQALKQKQGTTKFSTIIVANGVNYPDALSGSYLAEKKNAPILLVNSAHETLVKDYIVNSLKSGGKVYILGGTSAVSSKFETLLKNNSITVKRLSGDTRYQTNIAILKEAGVTNQEILVCSGTGFADSLSASAVGLPILLVDTSVTSEQLKYLSSLSSKKMHIVGGESAVSKSVETTLKGKGYTLTRYAGKNRYETSELVAKAFFPNATNITLAYGQNFPDGLSGAPVASALNAPLLLAENSKTSNANAYAKDAGAKRAVVFGGTKLISDSAAKQILKH